MITKKDFAKRYAEVFNNDSVGSVIDADTASFIIDTMAYVIKEIISDMDMGESFNFRGLGTFTKKERHIKTKNLDRNVDGIYPVVTFAPSISLKEFIRGEYV